MEYATIDDLEKSREKKFAFIEETRKWAAVAKNNIYVDVKNRIHNLRNLGDTIDLSVYNSARMETDLILAEFVRDLMRIISEAKIEE